MKNMYSKEIIDNFNKSSLSLEELKKNYDGSPVYTINNMESQRFLLADDMEIIKKKILDEKGNLSYAKFLLEDNEIHMYEYKDGLLVDYFVKKKGEFSDGDYYYNDAGELHRDNGPAVITNTEKRWYQNGILHREYGAAIEDVKDHGKNDRFFLDGEEIRKTAYGTVMLNRVKARRNKVNM